MYRDLMRLILIEIDKAMTKKREVIINRDRGRGARETLARLRGIAASAIRITAGGSESRRLAWPYAWRPGVRHP